jgi:hypothetical protein
MTFRLTRSGNTQTAEVVVQALVVAGWTGRDHAAVEKHIAELEELGVQRPSSIPVFYRVAASRLTSAGTVEVSGGESSGEVEFVLLERNGELWVGAGSDHTDRKVESYNITVSKQMCDKPVAEELWHYGEVADHWDRLLLRSWTIDDGRAELYQEGSVAAMLSPANLISRYTGGAGRLGEGTVMFGGTIAARGGIRPAERFRFELADPVLGRSLRHEYGIRNLPVPG